MAEYDITLTFLNECFALDKDTGVLTWKARPRDHFATEGSFKDKNRKCVGRGVGTLDPRKGRMRIFLGNRNVMYHRVVFAMFNGIELSAVPPILDHIDGNALNNRPDNLRPATPSQSVYNRGVSTVCQTGVKGVIKTQGKARPYRASIKFKGYRVNLGAFETLEEAAVAYRNAAIDLHGEFART
jgi:hypothetical protein